MNAANNAQDDQAGYRRPAACAPVGYN